MNKVQWFFVRATEKVGIAAGFAWFILLLIVAYVISVFVPAQQKLESLEKQLQEIPPTEKVVYVYESPSDQFFRDVPDFNSVTTSIQTIFDEAKKQRIDINEVVYKDVQRSGEHIIRYTMSFSVVASYPKVKDFILNSLSSLPYLALEQLTFERDKVNKNMVTSYLRFTLYVMEVRE